MSETPDEEVEYGPIDIDANLNTDTDHARSTPENVSKITGAEISSQYIKKN